MRPYHTVDCRCKQPQAPQRKLPVRPPTASRPFQGSPGRYKAWHVRRCIQRSRWGEIPPVDITAIIAATIHIACTSHHTRSMQRQSAPNAPRPAQVSPVSTHQARKQRCGRLCRRAYLSSGALHLIASGLVGSWPCKSLLCGVGSAASPSTFCAFLSGPLEGVELLEAAFGEAAGGWAGVTRATCCNAKRECSLCSCSETSIEGT